MLHASVTGKIKSMSKPSDTFQCCALTWVPHDSPRTRACWNFNMQKRTLIGCTTSVWFLIKLQIRYKKNNAFKVLHGFKWFLLRKRICLSLYYTGCFIMFSVITNIYNKKTKGPTLMELFTATGKTEFFFITSRGVRFVHHEWHGAHRYDIQVLATHTSTWVLSACTDTQFQ